MKKLAILLLLALPVQAETKMTATEFEAFSKNSTVAFNRHGMPFGAEQYLDDRRVIWSFLDGNCQRGVWYDEGDQICFHYDGQSNPLCWHFFDDDGQQSARLVGDDPVDDLIVVGKNKQPLACPGPEVGVRYNIE